MILPAGYFQLVCIPGVPRKGHVFDQQYRTKAFCSIFKISFVLDECDIIDFDISYLEIEKY